MLTDTKMLEVIFSNKFRDHELFPFFSEKKQRLESALLAADALNLSFLYADELEESILLEMLQRAHSKTYIEHVLSISKMGSVRAASANWRSKYVQWYTRISSGTYTSATFATGTVCQAVDRVYSGKSKRVFCIVRPPGHHAATERGEGFCVFNNVAVGALHARVSGFGKVAIVDFDRHHGNGTQQILDRVGDPNILLVSSFQSGCKYNTNKTDGQVSESVFTLPIPEHSDFELVQKLYLKKVIPVLDAFRPNLIIISAGFDMHQSDPLTNIRLSSADYFTLTRLLMGVADKHAEGRVVSVLEGGYNLKALEESVGYHLKAMSY